MRTERICLEHITFVLFYFVEEFFKMKVNIIENLQENNFKSLRVINDKKSNFEINSKRPLQIVTKIN